MPAERPAEYCILFNKYYYDDKVTVDEVMRPTSTHVQNDDRKICRKVGEIFLN